MKRFALIAGLCMVLAATSISAVTVGPGTIFKTTDQNHTYEFLVNHTFDEVEVNNDSIRFDTGTTNVTISINANSPVHNFITNLTDSRYLANVSSDSSTSAEYNFSGLSIANDFTGHTFAGTLSQTASNVFSESITTSNQTLEVQEIAKANVNVSDVHKDVFLQSFNINYSNGLTDTTSSGSVTNVFLSGTYNATVDESGYYQNNKEFTASLGSTVGVTVETKELLSVENFTVENEVGDSGLFWTQTSDNAKVYWQDNSLTTPGSLLKLNSVQINNDTLNIVNGSSTDDDLTSYYKFENCEGSFLVDEKGLNDISHSGVNCGSSILGTGIEDGPGANSDYSYDFDNDKWTISFWWNGVSGTPENINCLICQATVNIWSQLQIDDESGIVVFEQTGNNQDDIEFGIREPGDNELVHTFSGSGYFEGWNMYTVVRDGDSIRFYKNGNLDGSYTRTFTNISPSSAKWSFKMSDYDGVLDETRIYIGKALTESEMSEIYNSGTPLDSQAIRRLASSYSQGSGNSGSNDLDLTVTENFRGFSSNATLSLSYNLSKLTDPVVGVSNVSEKLFNITWAASSGGFGSVLYDVYLDVPGDQSVFFDDFQRSDSINVGNGWTESESVSGDIELVSGEMSMANTSTATHSLSSRPTRFSFKFNASSGSHDHSFSLASSGTKVAEINMVSENGQFVVTTCSRSEGVRDAGTQSFGSKETHVMTVDWSSDTFTADGKKYDFCNSATNADEVRIEQSGDEMFVDDVNVTGPQNKTLLASNVSGTSYEVNNTEESDGAKAYVTAKDGSFKTTGDDTFTITLTHGVSAVCQALTYPNENNDPSVAEVPVNFTVSDLPEDSDLDVNVSLRLGSSTFYHDACTVTNVSSTEKDYNCTVPMDYYNKPGNYDLVVNVTEGNDTVTEIQSGVCTYGQLVASEKLTDNVEFSNAGPGISNAEADSPITIKNTGNVNVTVQVTGYDLEGRRNPANTLAASNFKAGVNLTSAVNLEHGVQKNLTLTVPRGLDSTGDFKLWLSMPSDQLIQDYFTSTAWQLSGTG